MTRDRTVPETAPSTVERVRGPGWVEIGVGALVYALAIVLVAVLLPMLEDEAAAGLIGLAASGVMGLLAFAAAVLIRIRGLAAFGIRRARPRQLLVGAALGVAAYILGTVAAVTFATVTGETQNVQSGYQAAAAGGVVSLVLTLAAGSILTPLGEEAFFRGVVANALLARWPAWLAVVVSAALFAVAHGINAILPVAFLVGVLAALLFRWSGSIWPGVLLHAVNNAVASLVPVVVVAFAD
jgi:uncharacterized protein